MCDGYIHNLLPHAVSDGCLINNEVMHFNLRCGFVFFDRVYFPLIKILIVHHVLQTGKGNELILLIDKDYCGYNYLRIQVVL